MSRAKPPPRCHSLVTQSLLRERHFLAKSTKNVPFRGLGPRWLDSAALGESARSNWKPVADEHQENRSLPSNIAINLEKSLPKHGFCGYTLATWRGLSRASEILRDASRSSMGATRKRSEEH